MKLCNLNYRDKGIGTVVFMPIMGYAFDEPELSRFDGNWSEEIIVKKINIQNTYKKWWV